LRTPRRNNVDAARELRKRMTPAEEAAWVLLRDLRLARVKFRRQHPVGSFVLDFCCASLRLVIELDGAVHAVQSEDDQWRQRELEALGYRVMRFPNVRVLQQTIDFLNEVIAAVTELTAQKPLSRAPGEGLG
jgi:very-short-patch-repair endonuclease